MQGNEEPIADSDPRHHPRERRAPPQIACGACAASATRPPLSRALQRLENAARDGRDNLMPYIVDAVRAYATLGEMCNLLRGVYGEYREPALV